MQYLYVHAKLTFVLCCSSQYSFHVKLGFSRLKKWAVLYLCFLEFGCYCIHPVRLTFRFDLSGKRSNEAVEEVEEKKRVQACI